MTERAFRGILAFLSQLEEHPTQRRLAELLDLNPAQITNYQQTGPTREGWWRKTAHRLYDLGFKDGQREATARIMQTIGTTLGEISRAQMANALGVTQATLNNWFRGRVCPSARNIARLLEYKAAHMVHPIIEFEEIAPAPRRNSWTLHGTDARKNRHLQHKLQKRKGLYIFYDSTGRVTYVGKTTRCLWNEVRQRLTANANRPFYRPRRIKRVVQGQVARYLSAYEVSPARAIHNLEVLMLRAFPNDLANTNIGKFRVGL